MMIFCGGSACALAVMARRSRLRGRWVQDAASGEHDLVVQAVAERVRARPRGAHLRLRYRSGHEGHCSRHLHYKKKQKGWDVDLSELHRIVEVDVGGRRAVIEAGASFGEVCAALLGRFKMLPSVVPEFRGITIGGAIQGGGIESTSWQHGLFEDTVESMLVCTGDGRILTVSRTEFPEIFYGLFGSFGSVCIVLRATVRLMPAKRYVEVRCTRISSYEALDNIAAAPPPKGFAFHECIVYSDIHSVAIDGKFCDFPGSWSAHFSFLSEWFFERARTAAHFHMPTLDFLFRHDRGVCWCAKVAGQEDTFFSRLFGLQADARRAYAIEHQSDDAINNDMHRVVQDVVVPVSKLKPFLEWIDAAWGVRPLWICPVRSWRHPEKIFSLTHEGLFVNVGVYGIPSKGWFGKPFHENYISAHRALEDAVHRYGGRKALYSSSYYSDQEFWKVYDEV
eukprot:g1662.t1